jgi:Flp pilus assembly protein TadB
MKYDNRYKAAAREAAESRFARSVAACLSESAETVAPDVAERLRFAREKSLEIARRSRESAQDLGVTASGAAIAGFSQSRWWLRFASVLPLVALVGGLVLIQDWQNRTQISVAAEVDEALLGDDLPINAYRDPGFSEFLKAPPNE